MLVVQKQKDGFAVIANSHIVLSGIPTGAIAEKVVEGLHTSSVKIDWNNFDGTLWLPEQLAVEEAIDRVKRDYAG